MAKLVPGSLVRAGFVIEQGYNQDWIENEALPAIEGCLYGTGQFESVVLDYNRGGLFARDYLNIRALTAADFEQLEDYGGLVAEQIQLCVPDLYAGITRRDPTILDRVPEAVLGNPNVAQPNAVDSGPTGAPPKPPGKCDQYSGVDYLACQTGLTPGGLKTGGLFLGLGALLVVVLLIRK